MLELELGQIAGKIVEEFGSIDEDTSVLIVTDAKNFDVGKALTIAARSIGAPASLMVMPPMKAHSSEPPEPVAKALLGADMMFMATYQSFSHTDAVREAKDAGMEMVVMRGVTADMMLEGSVNTDYDELREVTLKTRNVLHEGSTVTVTSPMGTDITMDITDRPAFTLSGPATETGMGSGGGGLPPGEAPIAPVEGTSEGTIVIDYSMDNIGELSEPIELEVEGGYVTEVRGGSEADELRSLLADEDRSARNIAEFAIGTNKDSRLIGNLAEDKKKRGTVHFAVGDNISLGGEVRSGLHLDGVVLRPTVIVDDEVIVDDGELLLTADE